VDKASRDTILLELEVAVKEHVRAEQERLETERDWMVEVAKRSTGRAVQAHKYAIAAFIKVKLSEFIKIQAPE